MSNDRTSDAPALDLTGVLWRHKKKVTLFSCTTLAAIAVYVVLTPKAYQSDARVLFRESVGLNPTVLNSRNTNTDLPLNYEINSAVEVFKSRTLLGKAVDEIGADQLLAEPEGYAGSAELSSHIKTLQAQLSSVWPAPAVADDVKSSARDEAIRQLQKNLSVSSPRESMVIIVMCKAHTPELAQQIVATLVDIYIEEHMRFHRTTGSLDQFAEQTEDVRQRMTVANQRLNEFKSDKGFVSIEGQLQLLEAQKSDIEQEQLRVDRQLAGSQARNRELKAIIQSLDEMVVTEREGAANAAADGMRQQLFDLEISERELTARYTELHPQLKEIRRQLQTVRGIFDDEAESREFLTTAINPTWLQLQLSLLQEAPQLAALENSKNSLAQQKTELTAKIKEVNGYAIQLAQLQRQADLLTQSYQTHSANLEQARIDAAIEDQRISNVSVVQDASLIREPVGPSKKVVAALGLFVAMVGGVGVGLVCDYLDPTLKSPPEVEQTLDLPVLISIPRSARQRVHV